MADRIDWEALRGLVAVADHGSLTHAASALGLSAATLGRRIDALEAALGFRLVRRSPNGVKVTPEGQRVLTLIAPGAERFDQLARLARSMRADAERPPIRISSTEPIIADILAPRLPSLLSQHPNLRIELETSLEVSNLNRGDCDIAVRMVRPEGDSLIARRLQTIELGLFASPAYIGERKLPLDLREETLLWYDSAYGDIAENVWLKKHELADRVVLHAGSVRALAAAAKAGVGVAPLPAFIARQSGLVAACDIRLADRETWLVFHRDAKNDPTSSLVRAWIEAACKQAITSTEEA
jgi:DNA-binding transcriptional LysR family regulator